MEVKKTQQSSSIKAISEKANEYSVEDFREEEYDLKFNRENDEGNKT